MLQILPSYQASFNQKSFLESESTLVEESQTGRLIEWVSGSNWRVKMLLAPRYLLEKLYPTPLIVFNSLRYICASLVCPLRIRMMLFLAIRSKFTNMTPSSVILRLFFNSRSRSKCSYIRLIPLRQLARAFFGRELRSCRIARLLMQADKRMGSHSSRGKQSSVCLRMALAWESWLSLSGQREEYLMRWQVKIRAKCRERLMLVALLMTLLCNSMISLQFARKKWTCLRCRAMALMKCLVECRMSFLRSGSSMCTNSATSYESKRISKRMADFLLRQLCIHQLLFTHPAISIPHGIQKQSNESIYQLQA